MQRIKLAIKTGDIHERLSLRITEQAYLDYQSRTEKLFNINAWC